MASSKDLMKLSPDELIGIGQQYGLTFHAGMKKSHMVQQLTASLASGWLDTNAGLINGVAELDETVGSLADDSMISDAAHVAQMLSGAGLTETFHAAMNGPSHHVEAVGEYLNRLGVSSDDVWMHMPKGNPNEVPLHFGALNNYMRDTLQGHQDIMPQIDGHYSGDIMSEYSTNKGGVEKSYNHLAQMYVDKEHYGNQSHYDRDVSRVASRLANNLGSAFNEVAFSAATGGKTSYMSALPQIGDRSIVAGISHPRAALNVSGLPLGSFGSGINPEYSLSASLSGAPGWSPVSKALYGEVSETVKSLAQVYRGETGLNGKRHVVSERDMILDSASRYDDIVNVRHGYENLTKDLADEPRYSAASVRGILDNSFEYSEAESVKTHDPAARARNQLGEVSHKIPSTDFTANFEDPTSWNSARIRREERAIAELDAKQAFEDAASPIKFHNLEQGSQEWLDFRKRYDITGSTVGSYLGNNEYTRPWAEMIDKIGLSRRKTNAFTERMFERGHRTEEVARGRVSRELGIDIGQTGAITNDNYPSFMYSPDGLIGDDAIWEHKNPERAGKFADLLAGDHPDYMDQVQLGMLVSGRKRALFSQTIGQETRSQWIDQDEQWYDRNKTRLDSVLGRLDAGRQFVADNPNLAQDELIAGARQAMTGDGLWKDVRQRSNRGYSAKAGTSEDPFLSQSTSNDYHSATSPNALSTNVLGNHTADAVKVGILAAQEENKSKGNSADGNPRDERTSHEMFRDAFESSGLFNDGTAGGGRGGGGGGKPPKDGGWTGDYGNFGGSVASGIAGGSLSSASSGIMQGLAMTPWGRAAAVGIGAIQIGNEVAETMNDFYGQALDAGMTNPNEYSTMSQGMEMLGLNSQQASQINRTTHSAYNTLLNGDPSGAVRIVQGTRGLLTIGDIRAAQGDPVALARIAQQRGQERGWSQQRIAGAMEMAGLQGMARTYDRTNNSFEQAGAVVQGGRDSDYADGTSQLEVLQNERARVLPGYNLPQTIISHGADVFEAGADAVRSARFGADAITSLSVDDLTQSAGEAWQDFKSGLQGGPLKPVSSGVNNGASIMQKASGAGSSNSATTKKDNGNIYDFLLSADKKDGTNDGDSLSQYDKDYYNEVLKVYNGDHEKAMAAYVEGEQNVDSAVDAKKGDWLKAMSPDVQQRVQDYRDWSKAGNESQQGASGFVTNGTSVGQQQTVVNINLNAKINNQQATATVSTPNGSTVTEQMNIGNGVMQKR